MGYPSSVDTGSVIPLTLRDNDGASAGSISLTANNAYFVSVFLPAPVTLTGVRVRFSVGGNGKYDVGIYSDNAGAPGTLLANAAATASSLSTSSAVLTPSFINGNLLLSPARYWLALWISNASDTPSGFNSTAAGLVNAMTGANGNNPLPTLASSITPADTNLKPVLIGLLSGGWT